ncbi:MAG: hypothetical protein HY790_00950 [Deltaproteobacteria bacterium]|nr:hypothetical protein [Deltaproteobacteria bacterium]MBI4794410.1 hypothetical protein [Deltaproteobacteria bacterium]
MAKKKQFAGKKTKLAELPLTRVLEQKAGDEAAWEELQTSAATGSRQLFLSLERTGEEAAGTLAAAYLQVLQELTGLQADLEPDAASSPLPALLPRPAIPPARNLIQALRLARKGLQDLHRLLSE